MQTAHLKEDKIIENDVDEDFLQKFTCQNGHLRQENVYTEGELYLILARKMANNLAKSSPQKLKRD